MQSLPQLTDEDIVEIDAALDALLVEAGARLAMMVDEGGFVVTRRGETDGIDVPTLGALAANSFAATQAISRTIGEPTVASLYQEGVATSLLLVCTGGFGLLLVVFPTEMGVGSVKYFAEQTAEKIAHQLQEAEVRSPGERLDLASLDLTGPLFRRRQAG